MKIYLFYHSIISGWNHGNAHFLRGITRELLQRGHDVKVFEPRDNWSLSNLKQDVGDEVAANFFNVFPDFQNIVYFYDPHVFQPQTYLQDAELVIVHEWNEPHLVKTMGDYRKIKDFILLFHDTHHRSVTAPEEMRRYDLTHYDGVLAFGNVIRDLYLQNQWAKSAWTWHEAADTALFKPTKEKVKKKGDLVWIGNWGDEERSEELHKFLIEPIKELKLNATFYGVRYPEKALKALKKANIIYGGFLPNYKVPEIFHQYQVTVHVPRRPYVQALPGIPTIRPFEAMACGIPLICSPWEDTEGLFTSGKDYLVAHNKKDMKKHLKKLLNKSEKAEKLAKSGWKTIKKRHTCKHRVDELMEIITTLQGKSTDLTLKSNNTPSNKTK
ncbi:MAG: glycosyltransferase [Saprospiraceae bacterium]